MDEIIKGVYTKGQEVTFGVQMPIEIIEDESSYVDLINQINNEPLDALSVKEKMIVASDSIDNIGNTMFMYGFRFNGLETPTVSDDTPLFEFSDILGGLFNSYEDLINELNSTIAEKDQTIAILQSQIDNLQEILDILRTPILPQPNE